MEFDKEKLKFELMDCFSEETWPKYNFEKLVNDSTIVGDFIVVKGSNFKACFDKYSLELVNLDIMEVEV
ncbi:MAG: hypothetical protein J6T31_03785 [Methanobrevibacter sp.]|nr:hypothetical protein [Methanobrevibacter sp.]